MSADLALINANVRTMNPKLPVAEAVAIRKNQITQVGTNKEIQKTIGKNTKIINLNGKTLLPGLIDTHIHVADFGRCLMWLDLSTAGSIQDLKRLLREKVGKTSSGNWIIGRGWNHDRFEENRLPRLSDIDLVTPNNPVVLYHETAMICLVNSKALELAGVTKETHAPSWGAIDRSPETGDLTGILRDSATNLVWKVVPEPHEKELLDATALACQKIVEAGVTSVHWLVISENELPIIQKLHAQGRLPVRVNVILPEALLGKAIGFQSADDSVLCVDGVFIPVDGYLDSKSAALQQPYSDDPNNNGKLLCDEQALASSVTRVLESGFQPVIHAMGDKAVDVALKTIEHVSKGTSVRFRIEQAAVLNKRLLERLKNQRVIVTVQPKVISSEFTVWSATERLGIERAKWLHPLKTLVNEGVRVAGGSDCPMEPLNPLLGVQEAVSRRAFPEQRLSVEESLRMYTVDAAYSSGEENVKGSIEVGKLADLIVLSSDPLMVAPDKIRDIAVTITIVNGKVLYAQN